MDSFTANGPQIMVDTTDFSGLNLSELAEKVKQCRDEILAGTISGQ